VGLYKKVSDVYEAFQFTGDPKDPGWPDGWLLTHFVFYDSHHGKVVILLDRTTDNTAHRGDWIVAGPRTSFRTVKSDTFAAKYESLDAGNA